MAGLSVVKCFQQENKSIFVLINANIRVFRLILTKGKTQNPCHCSIIPPRKFSIRKMLLRVSFNI
ncbi:hypothetical protein CXF77_11530 [Planococcus sp. MB-3u-09]|nr:hypothetical protein CXF66_10935 [Planococcus sp. Urea-trap-24]PKH38720.1 hypothetical protein CXF77_11530 [Planococcus sp. MB-3u-09]